MSYWEERGKYQAQADILNKMIPDEGESTDTRIELYRCVCNIYYDLYNNGGCNLTNPVRKRELDYIHYSGVETPEIDAFIEELEESESEDEYCDPDYTMACKEIDRVVDRVIEIIMASGLKLGVKA